MIEHKILLTRESQIRLYYIEGNRFFSFKEKNVQYSFYIPSVIRVFTCENNYLHFTLSADNPTSRKDFNKFIGAISNFTFFFKKVLLLKGLGLKAFLKKVDKLLSLKLGYSKLRSIPIENGIYIRKRKTCLILKSLDKALLGNFAYKIKSLREPDSYKGKGIWYKTEKLKLKEVKKKK